MGERYEQSTSKDEIQMANRHTEKYSGSLFTNEMLIKTTMKFHHSHFGMAILRKIRK